MQVQTCVLFYFFFYFYRTTKDDALLLTLNVDGDHWLSKMKRIKNYLEAINELYYKSSEDI